MLVGPGSGQPKPNKCRQPHMPPCGPVLGAGVCGLPRGAFWGLGLALRAFGLDFAQVGDAADPWQAMG